MKHKGYGLLDNLDFSKGGIPETGKINKNRSALLQIDRDRIEDNVYLDEFAQKLADLIDDLIADKIDSITIDVVKRSWDNRK